MQNDLKLKFNASDVYLKRTNGLEKVRVGVGVALLNEQCQLLLELRSDVSMWGITGGKLDAGETPEKCGIREIYEETGICLKEGELSYVGIYAKPEDGRILQYPDNRVHLLDIVYTAKISSETKLRLSRESLEMKFFSVATMPDNIVPPAIRPINDLMKKGCIK